MALAQLVLRPDLRLMVAALGAGAAMVLPVAAALLVHGLDVRVEDEGWVAYDRTGSLDLAGAPRAPDAALARTVEDGRPLAAYVVGDTRVTPTQTWAMGTPPSDYAGRPAPSRPLLLLGADDLLVHPDRIPGAPVVAAYFAQPVTWPGVVVLPARGSDAFESAGASDVRGTLGWLLAVAVPAAALVAVLFCDQEAREGSRNAAILAALGRPRLGRRIVMLRGLLVVVLATLVSAAVGAGLYAQGGKSFHPEPFPVVAVALALGLPAVVAAVSGAIWATRRLADPTRLLRAPPDTQDPPGPRLGFLPLMARPLALGLRALPVALVAAALFVVNVGLPLAASGVPASLAGEADEWVLGSAGFGGGRTALAPAQALQYHDDMGIILGEVVLPTTLDGHATVLRGGDWAPLAAYHGLRLVSGDAGGLVLGEALAGRLGLRVGDEVAVQATDRAHVAWLSITGIAAAPGLLADEGFVSLATGQELAGMKPTEVSVVRARPRSPEVLAALREDDPRIEVLYVATPPQPRAGEIMPVEVRVVNLGGRPGARELAVRVDGVAVAELDARVPGHGFATLHASIIVPAGTFRIDVNPTVEQTAGSAPRRIEAPATVAANTRFDARLIEGNAVVAGAVIRAYASLEAWSRGEGPIAEATAGPDGVARLRIEVPGDVVLVQGDPPVAVPLRVLGETGLEVTRTWLEPARPRPGQSVTAHLRVVNPSLATQHATFAVQTEEQLIDLLDVTLEPGGETLLTSTFLLPPEATVLEVGGIAHPLKDDLSLRDPNATEYKPPPVVRGGASLQVEVADRVLGDARRVLGALATTAVVSTLATLLLAFDRALSGRAALLATLESAGLPGVGLRRRAAVEAGIQGALAALVALALAALAWSAFGHRPMLFGHHLPNPLNGLFVVQTVLAFAAVSAVAALLATRRTLERAPRGRGRGAREGMARVGVREQLEGA